MVYVLSQIFVIISYIFLSLTYLQKKRKYILLIGIISLIALAISYFFLSAYTGVAMTFVAIIRNIIFFCEERRNNHSNKVNKKNIYVLIILYCFTAFFAVYTYEGFGSIFSILETVIYTFSVWYKNPKVYKYLGIPASISCIFYHIYVHSTFGIILESILLITEIFGILSHKDEN